MKVCQYCDTVNPDEAAVCSGCGASLFYHKCNNCGKLFEGLVCPDCGIRADAQAVKCPSCGRAYFSYACPHCGYSPAKERDRARALEEQRLQLEKERREEEDRRRREAALKEETADSPYEIRTPVTAAAKPVKKKRHLLLWILGWIFIFPLPLTILLTRKQSGCLGRLLKLAVILFAWLCYFGILAQNA